MIRRLWNRRRRDIKAALEMRRLIETGEMDLHTVGVTPGGREVKVPTPMLAEWNAMSPEVREAILSGMDGEHDE